MYTQSLFFSKKAEHGLLAHVYEHAIANMLEVKLERAGLYILTDYSFWGKTYGTTCVIECKAYSPRAYQTIQKMMKRIQKQTLSSHIIEHAVKECGLEYGKVARYDISELSQCIAQLHNTRWQSFAQLGATQASTDSSVNTVYKMPGIQFIRSKHYTEHAHTLEYRSREASSDPVRMAATVLVTQALAQNVSRSLRQQYVLYETGDQWDEGATYVAYRNYIVVESDETSETIQKYAGSALAALANDAAFVKSFTRLLAKSYTHQDAPYFSLEAMNRITDGTLIGGAGWKRASNSRMIRDILSNIDITVL